MKNTVRLKKLVFENFKGIRNLEINFEDKTNIYGANATGKTSLFDAFTWLLFGKDSTDRKDFEVKTLDANNNVIEKIDHSVECILWVNDEEITLKRVLREKWVKQRGALEATFTGNDTLYYWNEVPMKQKEYNEKISEIINEDIFKLITNPLAFNSLKWQDRRTVLTNIAGKQDMSKLVGSDLDLIELLQLTEKKTIRELQAECKSKVTKIKQDLATIPTRIDEANKSKPEPIDFVALKAELSDLEAQLQELDKQLLDKSKAHEVELNKKRDLQTHKFNKETELNNLLAKLLQEAEAECKQDTTQIDHLTAQIKTNNTTLETYKNGLKNIENQKRVILNDIEVFKSRQQKLRDEWSIESKKQFVFDESESICKCCNRPFDNEDVESRKATLLESFNANRLAFRNKINEQGQALKQQIEVLQVELSKLEKRIEEGNKEISTLESDIKDLESQLVAEKSNITVSKDPKEVYNNKVFNSPEVTNLKSEIEVLNYKLSEEINIDNQYLIEEKNKTQKDIDIVKKSLSLDEQIQRVNTRINELLEEEKTHANNLNKLEKQQYTIERFIKLEIESLEQSINDKFNYVLFKMFETQINGGEVETCKTLINGVPFSDANTASKINAGIDIINVLNEYYNVSAPIFIDNRESVTSLIDTESQVINLIVSPEDLKLRVENN